MNKIAFIFPGQGSQYVGMGKDFYEEYDVAREVFEEANTTLNKKLTDICFNRSIEDLSKTENTQPAILATSIAILRAIQSKGIDCEYTAGLSLGEYSSLVMSGTINFKDAVNLVEKRGRFMQEAVPLNQGGMLAIIGLDKVHIPTILENSSKYGIIEVANYNSPEQVVLSGELKAVEAASELANILGAKKAVMLPVSAPFHSSLLLPAGIRLEQSLLNIEINDIGKKFVSNVKGAVVDNKSEVVSGLIKQVSKSVLWEQSIELMINDGVDVFIEIGPGKSLSGFVKRISKSMGKKIKTISVSDIETFNKMLDYLKKNNYCFS